MAHELCVSSLDVLKEVWPVLSRDFFEKDSKSFCLWILLGHFFDDFLLCFQLLRYKLLCGFVLDKLNQNEDTSTTHSCIKVFEQDFGHGS